MWSSFQPNTVHIWRGDLDCLYKQRSELECHLDPAERERARQFLREADRTRFIAGRGQLRALLSCCIGTPPAELAIAYTAHGKPFLPDFPDWHFNVSHSQNLALWAVAYEREVGIDIEQIRPDIALKTLVIGALCEREQHLLRQCQSNRTPLLLQFWTRKEGFLKATGYGLSTPLSQIDVSDPNGQIFLWDSRCSIWQPFQEWKVRSLETFPNCVASIAARGQDWTIEQHEL